MYHQVVREKSNDKVSHSETGYWIWDKNENTIMNSFSIPRGVCVLAGGKINIQDNKLILNSIIGLCNVHICYELCFSFRN